MSLLHSMAVTAAPRRTHALATDDAAPSSYPVIVDVFTLSSHGGLQPRLTVVSASAIRATALAGALDGDAVAVTCRVGPETAANSTSWIAVHTASREAPEVLATGTSLEHDAEKIRTGGISARPGPARVLSEVISGIPPVTEAQLKAGETAFLYTDNPNETRPFTGAWYWPTDEGFLVTAADDGFGYRHWQAQVGCILGLPEPADGN